MSRQDGANFRARIQKEWEKYEKLIFDFNDTLIASVSFMDEAFAKLASYYSKEELQKKLKFVNMREFDRAMLNNLVMKRLKEQTNGTDEKMKNTPERTKNKKGKQRAL